MSADMPSGFFDGAPIVLFDPRERELAFMMRRLNRKIVLPVPTTMWGFFHNPCIHESAPSLVSLHVTKRGAFKAMLAHRYDEWMLAIHRDRDSGYGQHLYGFMSHRDAYEAARGMEVFTRRHIAPIPVQRS